MEYQEFIENKKAIATNSGFHVSEEQLSSFLFPFQNYIVKRALSKGRYAVFADCGLGKTLMELEFAFRVVEYTNQPVIILAPLAVVGQTIKMADKFGYECIEWQMEMNTFDVTPPAIYITNYEQLDNVPAEDFAGIVLDESSILKNFEGAYRNQIIDGFVNTPYKLACTATPSPNDPMELGNHSEFLNVMSRNEMLSMFFVHDGGDTSKWRLKKHSRKVFYKWVNSWGIMLSKPSDIGFSDDGYILPGLNLIEQQIKTASRNSGKLFNNVAISATNFNTELRLTKIERLDQVANIVNGSSELFLISVKQNEEGDYLKKAIPDAIEVRGSDSPEYKKSKLLGFANDEFRVLLTKAKIVQYGMNYQNCHNIIIASPDFSYESLYQLIRRCLRFGQAKEVNVYMITTDTMQNVIESIRAKEAQDIEMRKEMQIAMNEGYNDEAKDNIEIISEYITPNVTARLGDCVKLIKDVPDESVGFSIFSPPFPELYCYSDDVADMGNCKDFEELMQSLSFLAPELYRVLWSGRNVAIHCMDTPIQKGKEGYIGLRDFSGMLIDLFTSVGFIYHSRVTIWKDPVVEMQRTKALGLLHKQVKKDAAMSRVGLPDYLLVFRKPGEHKHPVKCNIPVDLWQKYASPVWFDIDYSNTLNGREGRDEKDEKHICPLQLDSIERATHLWTNPGDIVLTTFGGIGSEVYQAIKMGRKGILFELKPSYFKIAVGNIKSAELSTDQGLLFDLIKTA